MKRLHLVDASAYIFRAFFGLRPLTAPDGRPTNAVYGYAKMLIKILEEAQEEYVAAVFDAPAKSFRNELYDQYKANRPPAPEEIKIQIPLCMEFTDLLGVPTFSVPGYEADDTIATLTTMGQELGVQVVIHSADKDLMQLVNESTTLYDAMRQKTYDAQAVEAKFGVPPELVGDLLALMGDSSDNIPGVAGVGPKTASKLLKEYGSLGAVLEAGPTLKGKLGQRLVEGREAALLSRSLVELKLDVPLTGTLEELARFKGIQEKLLPFLEELGFKQILAQLRPLLERPSDTKPNPSSKSPVEELVVVRDLGEFSLPPFPQGATIALYLDGGDPLLKEPAALALSDNLGKTWFFPLGNALFRQGVDPKETLSLLAPLFADSHTTKSVYQHKTLVKLLSLHGLLLNGPIQDPLILSYLVDASRPHHTLETLVAVELEEELITCKSLLGTGRKRLQYTDLSLEEASSCAQKELCALYRLGRVLRERLSSEEETLYTEMELPLTKVLAELELEGILLDTDQLATLASQAGKEMVSLEKRVHGAAGYPININSPKQLQKFLFEEQGIVPLKRTKTGFSTDAETLEVLSHNYEVARWIHEYRTLAKLMGTYITALPKLVNPVTHRIHTSFNQAVAATGRLSSSDPNLQNIPIRTPFGKRIREAFVAPDGCLLVALDYSQIELRVLAHLCEDEGLIAAFQEGKDIHTATASEVFDTPPEEVTGEMRRLAKAVNFGVIYGQTAFGLAKTLQIPPKQAREYISLYFARYPRIKSFMENAILFAKTHGYAKTMEGRRRPMLFQGRTKAHAERMAQNMPIQGSAADILKRAMIKANAALAVWPGVKLLLTVHDELVFEVPAGVVSRFGPQMATLMEGVVELKVPLKVEWSSGPNWSAAH